MNSTVGLVGRVGGALPGRKVLTLVTAILAGGSHIDHADKLRAGATAEVLPFRVMAPSTLGTSSSSDTNGSTTSASAHGGTLPFTGINVWACAAIGLGLLGTGLALRRSVRAT